MSRILYSGTPPNLHSTVNQCPLCRGYLPTKYCKTGNRRGHFYLACFRDKWWHFFDKVEASSLPSALLHLLPDTMETQGTGSTQEINHLPFCSEALCLRRRVHRQCSRKFCRRHCVEAGGCNVPTHSATSPGAKENEASNVPASGPQDKQSDFYQSLLEPYSMSSHDQAHLQNIEAAQLEQAISQSSGNTRSVISRRSFPFSASPSAGNTSPTLSRNSSATSRTNSRTSSHSNAFSTSHNRPATSRTFSRTSSSSAGDAGPSFSRHGGTPAPVSGEHQNRFILVYWDTDAKPPSARYVYDCPTWSKWSLAQSSTLHAELGKTLTAVEYFDVNHNFWVIGNLDHVVEVAHDQCVLIRRHGVRICANFASFLARAHQPGSLSDDSSDMSSDEPDIVELQMVKRGVLLNHGPVSKRAKLEPPATPPVSASQKSHEEVIDLSTSP